MSAPRENARENYGQKDTLSGLTERQFSVVRSILPLSCNFTPVLSSRVWKSRQGQEKNENLRGLVLNEVFCHLT